MRKRLFAVGCILSVITLPAATQAKTLCGEKTHSKYGETRIFAKNYIGTCRPDGSCAAVTYKMNPSTNKSEAPLDWDHRLAITRQTADAPWKIVLTAVTVVPDISEGIDMIIDRDGGNKVPFEFLQPEQAINELSIDTKLSDVFLEKFKAGSNARWIYTVKSDGTKNNTLFSLVGLTRAMKWIECAQK